MVKKQNKKLNGFELVKSIGYVLVIVLIFSPLTFLVSNTITGTVENDCYRSVKVSFDDPTYNNEYDECQDAYALAEEQIEQQQFLIVSIISIITLVVLLFFGKGIDAIISYSLFFASALNTMIVVIGNSYSSLLAAALGIILFILVLVFINKNLKKN